MFLAKQNYSHVSALTSEFVPGVTSLVSMRLLIGNRVGLAVSNPNVHLEK